MKVYFQFALQNHAMICHEMAKHWKASLGWIDFAGLTAKKGGKHVDYLRRQNEIRYHYIDDIDELDREAVRYAPPSGRVALWESRLDCPLWHLVVADRNIGGSFVRWGRLPKTRLMSYANHEGIQRYVCFYLDFFERRLRGFAPDFVFFTVMAALPAVALAKVSQFLGIPFYIIHSTRISDKYIVIANDLFQRLPDVEQRLEAIMADGARGFHVLDEVDVFVKSLSGDNPHKPASIDWLRGEIGKAKRGPAAVFYGRMLLRLVHAVIRAVPYALRNNGELRGKEPVSSWWLQSRRQRALRRLPASSNVEYRIADAPYVYYPLHLDPEASTMVLAPQCVDQLHVIDVLAKSIPLTHKLYVKEHLTMVGKRPQRFYSELRRYPNVRLLGPQADSIELIRGSSLVATITGTAGLEAAAMGKPVVMFGRAFFSHAGIVEYCHDPSALPQIVARLLTGGNTSQGEDRQRRLRVFMSLIQEFAIPLYDVLWRERAAFDDFDEKDRESLGVLCGRIEEIHRRRSTVVGKDGEVEKHL